MDLLKENNMTNEEKQLLLIDLCERSPYGVMCLYNYIIPGVMQICNAVGKLNGIIPFEDTIGFMVNYHKVNALYNNIRPYLRPMSSMTEEEREEFDKLMNLVEERCINAYGKGGYTLSFTELNDWLNKKMFDYRGLIPMGLALEAKEGMYKTQ